MTLPAPESTDIATFGSGCFWCTEAVFLELDGVQSVVSGYSGGARENPSYQEVCTGKTGHAEVIQIRFDPARISFDTLLAVFFQTHDPTTINRQGNDVGSQYRSVIFFHNADQRQRAEQAIQELTEQQKFDSPIVTEISPLINFYPAEDFHQNYFACHGHEPYCSLVIRPKVEKFRTAFPDQLKKQP